MQATRNKPQPPLRQWLQHFSRRHLVIATAAVLLMLFSLVMAPGQSAEDARVALPVELVLQPKDNSPATEAIPELTWVDIQVRNGDNLSKIFQRASLSAADVHDIVSNSKDSKRLLRLYPGETLSFQVNAAGKLQGLKHTQNKFESTLFERDSIAEGFSTTHIKREPEIRQNYNSAVISSSLFMAAQNTGLSQNLIMELSDIFGGVIDFVYDVRGGDSFSLLYEEHFLDDDKTGNGPILAAQFTNRGDTFTAYRYVYADGSFGYYNEKGVSMRKAFLRAPLDFTRISSGFNLKRLHPVFKTTRAHRGTDYAASRGTPVYAAGDGRVAKSGYSKANGNYVFINHGSNYTTKYLHLHKRNVRSGQKVKQRQVIGTVGSTGYATGPHLHYEFLVNGVHRNPRTILKKLPKAESINSKDKPLFLAQIGGLQMQLAAYNDQRKLAKAADLIGSSTL